MRPKDPAELPDETPQEMAAGLYHEMGDDAAAIAQDQVDYWLTVGEVVRRLRDERTGK